MTCATATFPEFTSFELARGEPRRGRLRGIAVRLATVAGVGVAAAFAVTAAVWIVAAALSINPNLHPMVPIGLDMAVLTDPYRPPADAADLGGPARALTVADDAPEVTREAEVEPVAVVATASAAADAAPLPPKPPLPAKPMPERAQSVPAPVPRPRGIPNQGQQDIARLPAAQAAPQVAALPSPASASGKSTTPRPAHPDTNALPDLDSRTAVYDIEAHTVYLPDGERLEAHSGLGDKLDDPRYVNLKDRGPTPPNVYDLTLREELFHGVRAIRLNPIDDRRTFGRDGMLAHTYMLGPTGQSFGCVSFRDYQAFLHAFLRGEVDRLVVVPRGGTTVLRATPAGRGQMAALQDGS
jgi:hypothetical protein